LDIVTGSMPSQSAVRRNPADGGWPEFPVGLMYGGDYNPEQWDESVWREDVELMRAAGVNVVNLGIFVWAIVERDEGVYDFALMDAVMDLLHESGIRVNLATPTASPPAWLVQRHPDILPTAADGQTLGLGARESFCPSSPHYRAAAASIASALARRYGQHPALTMWHVHNEYGAHVGACYCPTSAAAFRGWLQQRYATLEALNDAWGTTFWGQTYSAWDQLGAPRPAPMPVNPAQQLDFMRFTCEEYIECYRNERDVLRAITPAVPITTNFMVPACVHMDYWRWADEVDIVANDHYLTAGDPRSHVELAMSADLTRSLAGGKPWLLMEHSTSAVNWQPRNVAKLPDELRRNSLSHIAHGADGAMFFQWRASRFGAEKFHSAMLPHAGTASRTWLEVRQLGADLRALEEVRASRVVAEVAIVWDWPSWWALELEYRPSVDLTYLNRMRAYYEALWDHGITVDFVRPTDLLSGYSAVVVPSLYMVSPKAAANLDEYVRGGGTALVSYFSGIVDEHDCVYPGSHPGALRDMLGLTIEEFHPLLDTDALTLSSGDSADSWSERIVLAGADVRDCYASGPDAGQPAITRHAYGDGKAWYVGTRLESKALHAIVGAVLADANVPVDADRPDNVEMVRRRTDEASYLFVLNHDVNGEAIVRASGTDLLTGEHHASKVVVPPSGVAVIREAGST
jgi:beta-galactosidase